MTENREDKKKYKKTIGRFHSSKKSTPIFDWLHTSHNPVRGETALWVAVITQAMMDALSRARNSEAQYEKHEAIHWLTSNSRDFTTVCLFAGMDPDYVRRKAKRTLAAPIPWRAEAGKGKRYLERKAYRKRLEEEASADAPPEKKFTPCLAE